VKKIISDEGPTPFECFKSASEIDVAAKLRLADITSKSRHLSMPNMAITSNEYELITEELSNLAMHACVVNQYIAHLACKKNASPKTLDFIDYMKVACRHLDKARRILEQYD
jgi:hypothetical protein